jgi:hypothetical protein
MLFLKDKEEQFTNKDKIVEIFIPVITVSEANGGRKKKVKSVDKNGNVLYRYQSEHWSEKATRHKRQKTLIHYMLNPHKSKLKLPCRIEFTRYAPKKLDRFDNLPMSLKYILDACCEVITGDLRPGRADDTEEIDVVYKQEISKEYALKIIIRML